MVQITSPEKEVRRINAIATVVGYVVLYVVAIVGGFWCLGLRFEDTKVHPMDRNRRDGFIIGTGTPAMVALILFAIGNYITSNAHPHDSNHIVWCVICSILSLILIVLVAISIGRLSKKDT
jgi:uncharacterized membrane-anchored protein